MSERELLGFVDYVHEFYNPLTGIYPIKGASVAVITQAIGDYVGSLSDNHSWGGGDSVDRERVRDIILKIIG